jgi:hypothetical protein
MDDDCTCGCGRGLAYWDQAEQGWRCEECAGRAPFDPVLTPCPRCGQLLPILAHRCGHRVVEPSGNWKRLMNSPIGDGPLASALFFAGKGASGPGVVGRIP